MLGWSHFELGGIAAIPFVLPPLVFLILLIVGMAGALLVSHDNGDSFTLHQDPYRRGFSSLLEANGGEIVAVGDFGVTKLSLTNFNTEK
jgi:hypothetical protein